MIDKLPPNITMAEALETMARKDPAIFCMYYRRLRGSPLTYDNAKNVTDAVRLQLEAEMPIEQATREYQSRLLKHRPFLLEPLRDNHPHKVYEKARQIGISELSITETVFFLWSNPGTKAIFTFPRDAQLKDFSTTRITPMFEETLKIGAILGQPNQTYNKRIGSSFLILRSAWESGLGEGIDADMVVLDEKDRMKEGVDIAFRESMKSSKFGWLREVSTPTLPGRGVDASYQNSDQRCWHVRCTKCNLEQEVLWPDNILQQREIKTGTRELPPNSYAFVCKRTKCRGPLDRINGRWIARYPERLNVRGYHMPQSIAPWIDATRLMQDRISYKFQQLWLNYCMGMPAKGENTLLTHADFENTCAGHQLIYAAEPEGNGEWQNVAVGIDWGHLNWCAVTANHKSNNLRYLIGLAIFQDDQDALGSVKQMIDYIAPFNPDIIIADAGYGKDRNAHLLKTFSPSGEGRFYACWYNPSQKSSRTFQPVWSTPEQARVLVDRTMQLKLTCRAIRDQELGLPDLDSDEMRLLVRHFQNLAPLKVEEEGEIREEISASGDDHFVHALTYSLIGGEKLTAGFSTFDFSFT